MGYAQVIYRSQAMSLFASEKSVAEFYALRDPGMGWYRVFELGDLEDAQVCEVIKNGYKNVFVLI